ncbi:hypothetical protein [Streptomyces sp. NPDC001833]
MNTVTRYPLLASSLEQFQRYDSTPPTVGGNAQWTKATFSAFGVCRSGS